MTSHPKSGKRLLSIALILAGVMASMAGVMMLGLGCSRSEMATHREAWVFLGLVKTLDYDKLRARFQGMKGIVSGGPGDRNVFEIYARSGKEEEARRMMVLDAWDHSYQFISAADVPLLTGPIKR